MRDPVHVSDSRLFGHLYSTRQMASIFSDRATLDAWLKVEAALAQAQSALGVIPPGAGAQIAAAASSGAFDIEVLGERIAAANHPLTPVVDMLAEASGDAAQYVHFGATTQDIMDTAQVLQVRAGLEQAGTSLAELTGAFARLAGTYRSLAMAGRTHGQHAVPITLGLKFALFARDVDDSRRRLDDLAGTLPVQLAGAAGTLATLADKAGEVRARLASLLDLRDPGAGWHTSRQILADIVSALAAASATCGRFAAEVVNLQRTEIAELAEGAASGAGGSSTMPQKRNPMTAHNIVGLARLMAGKPEPMLTAMMQAHERDMSAWSLEWAIVPESFSCAHACICQTVELARHLQVDEARIAANLAMTGGLIMSEAVMMNLAPDLGRNEAHHVVADIVRTSAETGQPFEQCLAADTRVAAIRTRRDIARMLDPSGYLGEAEAVVDRILASLDNRQ